MKKVCCCSILVLGFAIFAPFALAEDEIPTESVFENGLSIDEQRTKLQKKYRKALGLDDPIHTISLEANSIREYRITHENRVKVVLRQPENGLEVAVWNSRSLNEARDFIHLIQKGAVKSATVRNGQILEILLKDKAIP
jgi:hypothetical protein